MDWFTWLSRTNLEPSLVYEYGSSFTHNELEEDDITYFNHEFLLSMGISIAKHRLEILKLAKRDKGLGVGSSLNIKKLVSVIKKTKKCLVKYIGRILTHNDDHKALVLVPPTRVSRFGSSSSSRWKGAVLKRSNSKKRLMMLKQQGRSSSTNSSLMLTHGMMSPAPQFPTSIGASPSAFYEPGHEGSKMDGDNDYDGDDYWASAIGVQEIKWDAMFQDLKPT